MTEYRNGGQNKGVKRGRKDMREPLNANAKPGTFSPDPPPLCPSVAHYGSPRSTGIADKAAHLTWRELRVRTGESHSRMAAWLPVPAPSVLQDPPQETWKAAWQKNITNSATEPQCAWIPLTGLFHVTS